MEKKIYRNTRNYTGGRMGRRRRTRWTKTDPRTLLDDYTEVAA